VISNISRNFAAFISKVKYCPISEKLSTCLEGRKHFTLKMQAAVSRQQYSLPVFPITVHHIILIFVGILY
jgi:hypothetical protein